MKSIHIQYILSVIGTIVVIGLVMNIRFSLHCYQLTLSSKIICRETLSQQVKRKVSNNQVNQREKPERVKICPRQTKRIDFRSDSWLIMNWLIIIREFELNETQTSLSRSYFMFVLFSDSDVERFVNLRYQFTPRNAEKELMMLEIFCIHHFRWTRKTLFQPSISTMCVSTLIHCVFFSIVVMLVTCWRRRLLT